MSNGSPPGDTQGALNNVAESNATALGGISAIFGGLVLAISTVQPYAAAVVAIISLVEDLIQLGQPDPIQSELAKILQTTIDIFHQIGADDLAVEIMTRNTRLYSTFAEALTPLNQLKAEVAAHPTPQDVVNFIKPCINALDQLNGGPQPNQIWNMTWTSQKYWTDAGLRQNICHYLVGGGGTFDASNDAGYGEQAPPNLDGTTFVYTYSLPLYILAVSIFLTVGGSLDPNFVSNYGASVLQPAAVLLELMHDQVVNVGFTQLSPPDWTAAGLVPTTCFDPSKNGPAGMSLIYDSFNPGQVVGGMMEYGAVEKFSGCSSIGNAYQIDIKGDETDSDPALFNKLQLRLLKRTKDVYAAAGLPSVLQVINQLNALAGYPPKPLPTFIWKDGSVQDGSLINLTGWSFRQIIALSRLAPTAGSYSLKALARFIIQTQPFDTPYTNAPANAVVSFLELFTNVPG